MQPDPATGRVVTSEKLAQHTVPLRWIHKRLVAWIETRFWRRVSRETESGSGRSRVRDFAHTINADPFTVAGRLWTKTMLDPEEEKITHPGLVLLCQIDRVTH